LHLVGDQPRLYYDARCTVKIRKIMCIVPTFIYCTRESFLKSEFGSEILQCLSAL